MVAGFMQKGVTFYSFLNFMVGGGGGGWFGSDGEWFDHRSCGWSYIILGRRRDSSAFGLRDTVNRINGDHCNVTGLRRTRRDEPQGEGLGGHPHQAESPFHDQGYQLPPETTMWEWPSPSPPPPHDHCSWSAEDRSNVDRFTNSSSCFWRFLISVSRFCLINGVN